MKPKTKAVKVIVSGRVTGVGFRYFIMNKAQAFSFLRGYIRNVNERQVEAVFQGPADAIEYMVECMKTGPSFSHVRKITVTEVPVDKNRAYFHISY